MKTFIYKSILAITLLVVASGCRKELIYEAEEVVPGYHMEFDIDWQFEWELSNGFEWSDNWDPDLYGENYDDLRPQKPEGFGAVLYDKNSQYYTYNRELHLSSDNVKISVDETTRALLLYSDDSETISISNLSAPQTAYATTNTKTRASFQDLHSGERTIGQPDILYGAYLELEEMKYQTGFQTYKVSFKPLIYGYVIRFGINTNLEYLSLARGALAGMAEGIYLMDGKTSNMPATILFDCSTTEYGARAKVVTFGIPGHSLNSDENTEEATNRRYDLRLELLLKNGKVVTHEFDVTDQIKAQPRGGVIQIDDIEIPDALAKEPNSGFNPDVNDWGNQIEVYL